MLKYVLPLGLALSLTAAQSSQSTNHSANQQEPAHHWQSTNNQKAKLSMKTDDMLWQTDRARDAVMSHNRQLAMDHLNKAVADMNQIHTMAPNQAVIPIYTELEQTSIIAPLMAARHMNTNNQNTNNQNTNNQNTNNQNTTGSADRARSGVAVRDVNGELTMVGVDVNMANGHLQAAQHAVETGDWAAAASALNAVRDGVFLASVSTDLPLLKARENLALARDEAASNNWKDAHTALMSASHALSNYERTGGAHANDARSLQQQIDSYDQNLAPNHADAVNRIENWWNDTTNWMTNASSANSH
jgi:hypothetical protein